MTRRPLLSCVAAGVVCAASGAACATPPPRKPIEMQSIGTVVNTPRTAKDDDGDGKTTTPNSATPPPGRDRDGACTSSDFENVLDVLKSCEVPAPRSAELPAGYRDKLEVRVNAATLSITPGGRVDLTITLRNKSSDPLPLFFTLDPMARLDIETSDARGKRVDIPAGKAPKVSPPAVTKTSKITLAPGGTARIKMPWDAVKQKWAPDRAGAWAGKGPPRAPGGPLPSGKYTLRIVLPILAVFDRGELEAPKLPIEVGA